MWKFERNFRTPLTNSEINNWIKTFNQVLKLGLEFEYNLPEAKGLCSKQKIQKSCPCTKFNEACWEECALTSACDQFNKNCFGRNCTHFVPKCVKCNQKTVDCERCLLRSKNDQLTPKIAREYISKDLMPTFTYGRSGPYGVHKVVIDGSLLGKGGVEVITVGKRYNFTEFHKSISKIMDTVHKYGGYYNELCSIHMHLLTSYYGPKKKDKNIEDDVDFDMAVPADINELYEPVPEIILANFHQLSRKWQNAITWMVMSLSEKNHLTRWEKYRISLLETSALTKDMRRVVSEIVDRCHKPKYGFMNYTNMYIKGNNINNLKADKLHIEFRAMDANFSPLFVSAMAALLKALLIKATEISKYGTLVCGEKKWINEQKDIKSYIMNKSDGWPDKNDPTGRKADNHGLIDAYGDQLRKDANEMLDSLKHILFAEDERIYTILSKIADKPLALRLLEGNSWEHIEKDLASDPAEQIIDEEIDEIIDFNLVKKAERWEEAVASYIITKEDDTPFDDINYKAILERVKTYIDFKKSNGLLIWSSTLNSYIKKL